jgi:hypothetical protein
MISNPSGPLISSFSLPANAFVGERSSLRAVTDHAAVSMGIEISMQCTCVSCIIPWKIRPVEFPYPCAHVFVWHGPRNPYPNVPSSFFFYISNDKCKGNKSHLSCPKDIPSRPHLRNVGVPTLPQTKDLTLPRSFRPVVSSIPNQLIFPTPPLYRPCF